MKAKAAKQTSVDWAQEARVPPHDVPVEQALLACCILEGGQETVPMCIQARVKPESFYLPAHQTIYQLIFDLYEKGTPCDEVILIERLQSRKQLDAIGGVGAVHEIINRIDTPAHLPHYIKRVRDLELMRRVIRASMASIESAYERQEDVDQFLENVEKDIFAVSEDRLTDDAKPVSISVDKALQLTQFMVENKGELTGISCGFIDLDRMTTGLHADEMIVVAARPSMGKTSLALNFVEAAILPKKGKPVPTLMFSLEMGADQLAMRLLCSRAYVNMQKLKDGFMSKEVASDLKNAAQEIKKSPFWIDESVNITILEMRAKARRLAMKNKLGLIVIDYLQLISGTDNRVQREQQISEISRGVKAMAKELHVPVVVLSQLNRDSERERRQPRLSDLRESGAIEQDADLVLLLAKKREQEEEDDSDPNVLRDLIIAKQRNGPVGTIPLVFKRNLTRFESFSSQQDL
ncbi:MAG: replicative DNA helicase [Verrucomicrobia bacterium GWF2_51_19]|nr:MAG: replicative DNA helicase [Verrucomicrobia bacterium GWF2_51_19]HCJ12248.1 replicative DNA helicase [Opitutae bacterium]